MIKLWKKKEEEKDLRDLHAFQDTISKMSSNLVVVEFVSNGSYPCMVLGQELSALAEEYRQHVDFAKVDIGLYASFFSILSILCTKT